MKPLKTLLVLATAIVLVSGCDSVRETLGLTKRSPDEFTVYSRDPLVMPERFELSTPTPGATRLSLNSPRDKALKALLGPKASNIPIEKPSKGVEAFVREIGADRAEPNVRSAVNEESARLAVEDKTWGDRLRFWGADTAYGRVVDPKKEAKRIQSNRALGRAINDGEVPVLEEKRKALLEGVL